MRTDAHHATGVADHLGDRLRRMHQANRQAWNQAARRYQRTYSDDLGFLRNGGVSLHPLELELLGDLSSWCNTAVHLQCASGRDTLSLLKAGAARVIGLDMSDEMIALAERLSADLAVPSATWVRSDVLEAPHFLDGSADLVYTGQGALTWIQDIRAWAAVVARLLRPGGRLLLFDMHPALALFRSDTSTLTGSGVSYFKQVRWSQGWPAPYIGDIGVQEQQQVPKVERLWPLSTVVQSVIDAGLQVHSLSEHPEAYWPALPLLPDRLRDTLPKTFRLLARKPSAEARP